MPLRTLGFLFFVLLFPCRGQDAPAAAPVSVASLPSQDLKITPPEPPPVTEEIKPALPAGVLPPTLPQPSGGMPGSPSADAKPAIDPAELELSAAIYKAVTSGDEDGLAKLLESGKPVFHPTPDGDTALCAALRKGKADIAIKLLKCGADPNAKGLGNQSPIVLASLRRHQSLLSELLTAGADPNSTLAQPVTQEILDRMTDERFQNEMKKERNLTPLMICSARGDVEAVTTLLGGGAKTSAFSLPNRRYAINYAANRNYLFVMRLLLGRKPDSEPATLITVNLTRQQMTVQQEGKEILKTAISTGRRGYETPDGRYVITNKYKSWVSTIYKVPMPYFMRLNCGSIGLHSGHVTGRPASHGCIRLPNAIARKMFEIAQVGDEVIIEH